MNVKTTLCSKIISNVVKFHLHILIVSCISNFVLHSPLCKNICCNFFVSNHNLMCYVAFYACCLLIQSYWHCNCKIIIFKLIVWTSRCSLLIAKLFTCYIHFACDANCSMENFKVDKVVKGKCGKKSNYMVKLDLNVFDASCFENYFYV
jgi:hypothetical protein